MLAADVRAAGRWAPTDLLKTMIPIAIAATAMIAAPIVTIRRRFPGPFPRPCLMAPFLR